MPPEGFQPGNTAIEGPQTHALDRAASGICYVGIGYIDVI
jgi:hypothetical protein